MLSTFSFVVDFVWSNNDDAMMDDDGQYESGLSGTSAVPGTPNQLSRDQDC